MDCTDGSIDESVFGKPMPAIGAYAATGTLVCAIAMVVDAAKGFRSKQYWIPNNYFTMNAASLAVFGVAIKVLVDISAPMPSKIDQLGKLSSSAFICIMLVNIQPSLGKLEKGELLMNTIALSIFVINSILNICIEIHTGVIYTFIVAHIVMMVTMSLILYDSIVIAAYLPVLKNYLDHKFEGKYRYEIVGIHNDKTPKKLREYLMRVSMMAQSGCPHFVMARSSRSFSLVVLGLVSALTLFFIMFATITHQDGFINSKTCFGESVYGWSTFGILITQVIAVAAGMVAPISRYIYLMRAMEGGELRNPPAEKEEEEEEEEEEFWMQHLEVSKEKPIFPYIEDRQRQPAVYEMKYLFHQILSIHPLRFLYQFMNGTFMYTVSGKSGLEKDFTPSPVPEDFSPEPENLAAYFLHMKGEERSIKLMEKLCSFVTQRCIDAGKRANPHNLVEFLKEHLSHDFGGVASFDDEEIPPLAGSESPPNCWSLVVLTLTSVATALPIIDHASKERLMRSVNEGLIYVKLVEDHMNSQHKFINIRATANIVWLGLDRRCHWLDINLQELALKAANSKEVLFRLANSAREYFSNYTSHHRRDQKKKQKKTRIDMVRGSLMGMVSKARSESEMIRTCKAVAAHSMYRICQTMLQQQQEDCQNESNDVVFKKLSITIADILGACFVNLRPCIVSICERCSIEKRRDTVLGMLKVFGEIEEIMEILVEEGRNIPDVPDDERGFVDKWSSYLKHQKDLNSGHLNIV